MDTPEEKPETTSDVQPVANWTPKRERRIKPEKPEEIAPEPVAEAVAEPPADEPPAHPFKPPFAALGFYVIDSEGRKVCLSTHGITPIRENTAEVLAQTLNRALS